jgi:hypothetical protein
MNGMAHWYRPDGRLGPDTLAEQYADLFLEGLRAPPAKDHEGAAR